LIFETSNLPRCPFSTHMFGFVKALHWKEYVRGSICHTPPKEITAIFRKQTFRADIFLILTPCSKLIWWVSTFSKVVVSTLPPFSNLIWCPTTFCKIHFPPCSKLKRWVLMLCWCLFPALR
jgi:hypothetical protein